MDILKKMFQNDNDNTSSSTSTSNNNNKDNISSASATAKDEFRKPQWFEENESDDELFDDNRKFAFQVFTNPLELQKHFERQVQQIMESLNDNDDMVIVMDKNLKDEFLKPGFESKILKELEKQTKSNLDTDLDGEIYADQLHSIIQSLQPKPKEDLVVDLPRFLPGNDKTLRNKIWAKKENLTDEQKILAKIHGTLNDDETLKAKTRNKDRPDIMTPMTPMMPRGGVTPFSGGIFEGGYNGPKMFSQSVMTKTIRKPDGSCETTKITQDSSGNKTTTITKTINGKSETVTTYDGKIGQEANRQQLFNARPELQVYSDRNILVSKEGYALPRNLW